MYWIKMITAFLTAMALSDLKTFEEQIPGHLPKFTMVQLPTGKITIDGKTTEIKNLSISKTEVTWNIYDIYAYRFDLSQEEQAAGVELKSRPSKPYGAPDRGYGHDDFAALGMTYQSAVLFCEWLSKKTGKKYRLPTSAEWEYAARAGADKEPADIGTVAWYWDNAEDVAHKTGSLKPNAWGLFDMLGNAAEWVTMPDGTGTVAGGHFYDKADKIKFTQREAYSPDWQERDAQIPKSKWWLSDGEMIGLRVVCETP